MFWVIVALRELSSLHPPSKLLLGCLACTDLCLGMITQPLHVALSSSPEDSQAQNYIFIVFNSLTAMLGEVSLLTLTAVSVDRLLVLLMGLRYRQVVTLRRAWILVAVFWLFSIRVAMIFFNFRITIFMISIANGGGISLNIERYQTNYVQCIMGTNYTSGLLSSMCYRSYNIRHHGSARTVTWSFFGSSANSCFVQLISEPISVLLEDEKSRASSEGRDKTVLLFLLLTIQCPSCNCDLP